MSKFMKEKERKEFIDGLMVHIRKNTQPSDCIDVFEGLLNDIEDTDVIEVVVKEMSRFTSEFSRLCKFIDNSIDGYWAKKEDSDEDKEDDKIPNVDIIANILTRDFINPHRFFRGSRKLAQCYLLMGDTLMDMYNNPVYEPEKKIMISETNFLGDIYTPQYKFYKPEDIFGIAKKFGNLNGLSVDDVKSLYESARKVTLLYNYLPAVVKAFIQTKRRSLGLDKNSKKFK